MSFAQTIAVRDGDASLAIANNQTTGVTTLCPLQTTGTLDIGTSAGRTGAITVGNNLSSGSVSILGSSLTNTSAGQYNVTSGGSIVAFSGNETLVTSAGGKMELTTLGAGVNGHLIVESRGSGVASTNLGAYNNDQPTNVAVGALASGINIGTLQTTGVTNIATRSDRSGPVNIGALSGTHAVTVAGDTVNVSSDNDTTMRSYGNDVIITALNACNITSQTAGENIRIESLGVGSAVTSVAEVVSAIATDISLQASDDITLTASGSGSSLLQLNSDELVQILCGTTLTQTAGRTVMTSNGANFSGDMVCESQGTGSAATYLGAFSSDQNTYLGSGTRTSAINIGAGQTTGTLNLGTGTRLGGNLNIGTGTTSGDIKIGTGSGRLVGQEIVIGGAGLGKTIIEGTDMAYEVRTLTPSLEGSTSGAFVINIETCVATIWGRSVTVNCRIQYTSKGTAVGTVQLHFTGANTLPLIGSGQGELCVNVANRNWTSAANAEAVTARLLPTNDYFRFLEDDGLMTVTSAATSGVLEFSATYIADSI